MRSADRVRAAAHQHDAALPTSRRGQWRRRGGVAALCCVAAAVVLEARRAESRQAATGGTGGEESVASLSLSAQRPGRTSSRSGFAGVEVISLIMDITDLYFSDNFGNKKGSYKHIQLHSNEHVIFGRWKNILTKKL